MTPENLLMPLKPNSRSAIMEREALKLALEALNSGEKMQYGRVGWTEYDSSLVKDAITAIKEALAQPAQEPVARVTGMSFGRFIVEPLNPAMVLPVGMALYSSPQGNT
jgi:hypothetical protein